MMFIIRNSENEIMASIPTEKISDEVLNRWIRRGFKVAMIDVNKMA